jgi:hypothetical protein
MNKKDILVASHNTADERCSQLNSLIPETFSHDRLDVAVLKRALSEAITIECGERFPHMRGQARHLKSIAMPALSSPVHKNLRKV